MRLFFIKQSWPVVLLTILVFLLAIAVRVRNLNYNSPFNDEAIYVVVGQSGLFSGDWVSYNAASWMAGSPYFYPPITAISYKVGGLVFSRMINAVFGVLTLYVIYLTVLHIAKLNPSGYVSALFTLGIIALIPSGVYISRLATYDAPSFFFLFFSFYLINRVSHEENYRDIGKFYTLAAISLFVAYAFKIVAVIFLPYFLTYSFVSAYEKSGGVFPHNFLNRLKSKLGGRSDSDLSIGTPIYNSSNNLRLYYWQFYFLFPFFIFSAIYLTLNLTHIYAYYSNQEPLQNISRSVVLNRYWKEIYLVVPFWIIGSLGMFLSGKFKSWLFLSSGALMALIFHMIFRNAPSLDKHTFLSIPFLGIVGGLGIENITGIIKRIEIKVLLNVIFLAGLGTSLFLSYSQLPKFNNLWRNTYEVQKFVGSVVKNGDKVLAETGASIVLAASEKNVPTNIITYDWFEYRNLSGTEAYVKAIEEGYFNLIELEDLNQPKLERNSDISKVLSLFIYLLKNDYKKIYSKDGFLIYQRAY